MEIRHKPRCVLIPDTTPGRGTGHMFRCLRIAQDLESQGMQDFLIIIDHQHPVATLFPQLKKHCMDPEHFCEHLLQKSQWLHDVTFILDKPKLAREQVTELRTFGKIMALDGGGEGRELIPYLVDTLPNLFTNSSVSSPWFLPLPELQKPENLCGRKRILIAMGGEDATGLTLKLMNNKACISWLNGADVTVLQGPGMDPFRLQSENKPHWNILPSMPNLKDQLGRYDLVITIFGLTAFESMASGTPVLLVHPTSYHKKLTANAKLPDLFETMKKHSNFSQAYSSLRDSLEPFLQTRPDPKLRVSLAQLILVFIDAPGKACPCCASSHAQVLYRFPERSFLMCNHCHTEYQLLTKNHGIHYTSEYFFQDYKKQYGKDYLEDFEMIKNQGIRRLNIIDQLLSKSATEKEGDGLETEKKRLLDLGCAFGPFLKAGNEMGYQVHGIDVSIDAVEYVVTKLGLSAQVGDILEISQEKEPFTKEFDVISLWYVIEHFEQVHTLLPILHRLLKPGGILAIGTPSARGISRKRNPRAFFQASPMDHFSIWNPKQVKKVLHHHGFLVKTMISPSFHPTRYPKIFQIPWLLPLTRLLHHGFLLGDTLEIYGQKIVEKSSKHFEKGNS